MEQQKLILMAAEFESDIVFEIAYKTISVIYPHYYPKGVVEFFLKHHCRENIEQDIRNGIVYLLQDWECIAGTVTLKGNAINRLFVLPEYQGRGYGRCLMDFAENMIAKNYNLIHIDSSLPAKKMYLKRGYREVKTCHIKAEYGDVLIYDEMEKNLVTPALQA